MKVPQRKIRFASVLFFVVLASNFLMAQVVRNGGGQNKAPDGAGHGVHDVVPSANAQPGPVGFAVHTGNGINYNGGPVMKGTVNAYIIWYGNWNGTGSNTAATRTAIETFFSTIGGSALELVNSTYGDTTGDVTGQVHFGGSTIVSSTTNLTDARVQTQV
ncbi:MAG TPA: hypothetical protein VN872_10480, partial [Candidatus Acidoferrum sp.]|nr:hypothetical protein [Candidatus Acidoferrum sp.]